MRVRRQGDRRCVRWAYGGEGLQVESAAACILHLGQDGVEVEDRRELLLLKWFRFFVASRFLACASLTAAQGRVS